MFPTEGMLLRDGLVSAELIVKGVERAKAALKVEMDKAEAIAAEKKWRFGYARHVVKQVQLAAASEEAALGIAKAGLGYSDGAGARGRHGGRCGAGPQSLKRPKNNEKIINTLFSNQKN